MAQNDRHSGVLRGKRALATLVATTMACTLGFTGIALADSEPDELASRSAVTQASEEIVTETDANVVTGTSEQSDSTTGSTSDNGSVESQAKASSNADEPAEEASEPTDGEDELEIGESVTPEAVRGSDEGGRTQLVPANMRYLYNCASNGGWTFTVTKAGALPDDAKFISGIEIRLPLTNDHRMPDLSNGVMKADGRNLPFLVELKEEDGFQKVKFNFVNPLTADQFNEIKKFEVTADNNIGGVGLSLCKNKNARAEAIMNGAQVFFPSYSGIPDGVEPWDPGLITGGSAIVKVKVSDMHSPSGINPLPGTKLQLFKTDNPKVTRDPYVGTRPAHDKDWGTPGTPIDEKWAKCTVQPDGYCVFVVPAPEKKDKKTPGATYWVAPVEAPEGYGVFDEVRVGFSGGNGAGSWGGPWGSSYVMDYAYRTPQIYDGDVITSGSGGFMEFVRENQYTTLSIGEGVLYPRSSSGQIVMRRDNPPLPDKCGINVGLLLDTSGSMDYGSAGKTTKEQVSKFVEELRGTPIKLGFATFATEAASGIGNGKLQHVEPLEMNDAGVDNIKSKVSSVRFEGDTNWDDGLKVFGEYNSAHPDNAYDVILVVTDGNPTRSTVSRQDGPGNAGDFALLENTVLRANWVKTTGNGTRLIGVGVGEFTHGGVIDQPQDPTLSHRNMNAVFGPNGAPYPVPIKELEKKDWVTFDGTNDENLASILTGIAKAGCEASIVVEKETQEGNQEVQPGGAGWHFDASGLSEGFTFTDKPGASTLGAKTNKESQAQFRLKLDKPSLENGTITITEDLAKGEYADDGWDIAKRGEPLRNAVCVDKSKPNEPAVTVEDVDKYGFKVAGLSQTSRIHCKVLNRKADTTPSYIQVQKVDGEKPDKVLPGAEFALYPSSDTGELDYSKQIEPKDGKFEIQPGYYGMVETKAPTGYELLGAPFFFEVYDDGGKLKTRLVEKGADNKLKPVEDSGKSLAQLLDPETKQPTGVAVADKDGVFHVRVANYKTNTELPHTGGNGVVPLGLFAAVLIGLGLTGRKKATARV